MMAKKPRINEIHGMYREAEDTIVLQCVLERGRDRERKGEREMYRREKMDCVLTAVDCASCCRGRDITQESCIFTFCKHLEPQHTFLCNVG